MNKTLRIVSALALLCVLNQSAAAEGPNAPPPPMKDGPTQVPPWLNDQGPNSKGHPHLQKWMQHMLEQNPEEFRRLQTLRQEDPEAFRNELRTRLQKNKKQRRDGFKGPGSDKHMRSEKLKTLDKQNRNLAKQARKAEGEEREQIISDLRLSLEESFDERETLRNNHLEQARKELERHHEMAAQRQQNRDKIISEQVKWMLEGKKPQPPPPLKN